MRTLEKVNIKLQSENEDLQIGMLRLKREFKVIFITGLITLENLLLTILSKANWDTYHSCVRNVLCWPSRIHRRERFPNYKL